MTVMVTPAVAVAAAAGLGECSEEMERRGAPDARSERKATSRFYCSFFGSAVTASLGARGASWHVLGSVAVRRTISVRT